MKKRLITLLVGVILVGTAYLYYTKLMYQDIFGFKASASGMALNDGLRYGTWLWQSPDEMNDTRIKSIIAFSKTQKINTLYVNLDKYIDLYEQPASSSRTDSLRNYENAWVNFIRQAKAAGLQVEALSGHTIWAGEDLRYIPLQLLAYTADFNRRHPDTPFSGIQFDIEFYNQSDFDTDKYRHTLDYLNTVSELVRLKKQIAPSADFRLGFALPPSMSGTAVAPAINWGGMAKPVMFHTSTILNRTLGGYIALMSYRKLPGGVNGSISISRYTVDYITRYNRNVSAIIGQETTNVEPASITFWGSNKFSFITAANTISDYFKTQASFKGIGIHDIDGYIALPN